MNEIVQSLQQLWTGTGSTVPPALPVLVFGSVFVLMMMVFRTTMTRLDVKRRAMQGSRETAGPAGAAVDPRSLRHQSTVEASNLISLVGSVLAPNDAKSYSEARKQMIRAGFFSPGAVYSFHAARILLAIVLPSSFLLLATVVPMFQSQFFLSVGLVCLAGLGIILPAIYVDRRQTFLRNSYRSVFPDFLDLLVVCIEAGLSLQPALERVARQLGPTCPDLSMNLHLLGLELRAGRSLTEALASLNERLDIEEGFSLASLLRQSEELGTSLATALRVFSDEMRNKRLMRAEAKAQALPVKILMPVGFCIFPVILVTLFLPLALRIKQIMLH